MNRYAVHDGGTDKPTLCQDLGDDMCNVIAEFAGEGAHEYAERCANALNREELERERVGGPAFPHLSRVGEYVDVVSPGMSLRDYFAGIALGAYLAAPGEDGYTARLHPDKAATWAYENADSMLAERAKQDGGVPTLP